MSTVPCERVIASSDHLTEEQQRETLQFLALDINDAVTKRLHELGVQVERKKELGSDAIIQQLRQLLDMTDGRILTVKRSVNIEHTVQGLPDNQEDTRAPKAKVEPEKPMTEDDILRKARHDRLHQRIEDLRGLNDRAKEKIAKVQTALEDNKSKAQMGERQLQQERAKHDKYKFQAEMWTRQWKQRETELDMSRKKTAEHQKEIDAFREHTKYIQMIVKQKDGTAAELKAVIRRQLTEASDERRLLERKCRLMLSRLRKIEAQTLGTKQSLEAGIFRQKKRQNAIESTQQSNAQLREELSLSQRKLYEIANRLDQVGSENVHLANALAADQQHAGPKRERTPTSDRSIGSVGRSSSMVDLNIHSSCSSEQLAYGVIEQQDISARLIADLRQAVERLHVLRALQKTEQMERFERQLQTFLEKTCRLLRAKELAHSPYVNVMSELAERLKTVNRQVRTDSTQSDRSPGATGTSELSEISEISPTRSPSSTPAAKSPNPTATSTSSLQDVSISSLALSVRSADQISLVDSITADPGSTRETGSRASVKSPNLVEIAKELSSQSSGEYASDAPFTPPNSPFNRSTESIASSVQPTEQSSVTAIGSDLILIEDDLQMSE